MTSSGFFPFKASATFLISAAFSLAPTDFNTALIASSVTGFPLKATSNAAAMVFILNNFLFYFLIKIHIFLYFYFYFLNYIY